MSAVTGPDSTLPAQGQAFASASPWLPAGVDRFALLVVLFGLGLLYLPTYWDFLAGSKAADSQGHEPLIAGVAAWLVWRRRETLARLPSAPAPWAAGSLLLAGLLL
jgi:hypothetical protein